MSFALYQKINRNMKYEYNLIYLEAPIEISLFIQIGDFLSIFTGKKSIGREGS